MSQLSILFLFWMNAFLVDLTEEWEAPVAAALFLALAVVVRCTGLSRKGFTAFLVLSCAYLLAHDFPDLGNHNNLYLFCSAFWLLALDRARRRPAQIPDAAALAELAKPLLRTSLALVYFFAGFHKLNRDFLDPAVSCGVEFYAGLTRMLGLDWIELPTALLLSLPILIIVWELGGGIALWFRRAQAPMLMLSWIMHSVLALLVFSDFAAHAFALLLAFVPEQRWARLAERARVRVGPLALHRADLYFALNLLMGLAAGLYFWANPGGTRIHKWQAVVLNLGLLVFLWPWLAELRWPGRRRRWPGVPIWGERAPRLWLVGPALLALFALNPYLGLRTAGTFSMFSNLRTEGDTSNHLLLTSNPLKLWGFQEDVVEVVALDPRHARLPRHSLVGYGLPVVEFRKRLLEWQALGLNGLHATFRYAGRTYETGDLVAENPWSDRPRSLALWLLDFRAIQAPATPNACRW